MKGLVTEHERRIELSVALLLSETGDVDLLVDHLRVCTDIMGIPLTDLRVTACNLTAAGSESAARMGQTINAALEVIDADAA